MFKRVEDDVLLGVSKVITRNNYDTGNLLIDEAKLSETKIEDYDEANDYTLEDLINITNENEELIRNIIEKKDGLKSEKEEFVSCGDAIDEDADNSSNDINEKERPSELVHRDEYNEMKEELLSSLKEQITYLKEQIDTKDKQLQNKDELIRNFQVLMKSDKDRIHELEAGKIEDINSEIEVEEPSSSVDTASETTKNINASKVTTKKRGLLGWFIK